MTTGVLLREVCWEDVTEFYRHHLSVEWGTTYSDCAASEKTRFLKRWETLLREDAVLTRTIIWRGSVAGYVAHFVQSEKPALAYWLGREFWGQGIATEAIKAFLPMVKPRPLYARVAFDNHASSRVLEKVGFVIVGKDRCFSEAHGRVVEEVIFSCG